jgi:flavin reductase (DIM6/NTAB) family NADH-FMN oxidoreductase RutF
MALDCSFFRQVMGRFATGVTIVTTCSHGGLVGLTVNSLCSVLLDPLLVLVGIDLNSNTLPHFRQSGSFVVNIP